MIKVANFDQLMSHPCQISTAYNLYDVAEVNIFKIIHSISKDNIPVSKTSRIWKPTQMIKVDSYHQLMSRTPQIVTQSTSENKISKSETSWLQNTTQIIKIDSYHQCIPQPCNIVTKEGIGPVWAIVCILCKLYLTDNSSRDFWKSWQSGQKSELIISNEIWQHIFRSNLELDQYFHIFLFSYLPGLYFVSSYLLKYTLNLKRVRCSNLI